MTAPCLDSQGVSPEESRARHPAWPFVILGLAVCAASTVWSMLMGELAGSGYGTLSEDRMHWLAGPSELGGRLGGASGLAAGVIWCVLMYRRSVRWLRGPVGSTRLVLLGVLWGVAVGLGAAALLHAGLMLAVGEYRSNLVTAGAFYAVPSGLALGLVSGAVWHVTTLLIRRRPG